MTRFVLIVLGIVLSSQAFGFDVDGYWSGMSLAEVQRRIGKLDRVSGIDGVGGDSSQQMYRPTAPSALVGTPLFTFCADKFYFYSLALDGGFPAFNRILERETVRLGRGEYRTENQEGRSTQLWISWRDDDATDSLALMTVGGVSPNPSVSQAWNAYKAVCQPQMG